MSQIAATTTRTSTSLLARTIGAGVSSTDGTGTASHIRQRLQIPNYGGSRSRGHALGKGERTDPPSDPNPGDGGRGGGGGGDPGDAGGGGDPPNPDAEGPAPPDPRPNRLNNKLIGNEPSIFNGEREQVEEFLTTWNLYQGLNRNTAVMSIPFDRAQLFLGYIRGPRVKAWVQDTSQLIAEHIAFGGRDTDEWIWTTVINDFAKTFQDHMSKDLARGDIFHIMMSHGLHESWQGRCRESFRFHGQLASADVGDSYYFLGSADVSRKRRRMSDISLYIRIQRLLQYFGDDE